MKKKLSAVNEIHSLVKKYVNPSDLCIDATAGNGHDTAFLCDLVGNNGKVLAFDIQEKAIISTKERMQRLSFSNICDVIHDGHENMGNYAQKNSVKCIMFNFGYLPSGDHNIYTKPESSIRAISQGLELLCEGGLMSLCIYSGGDTGFEERDSLLAFIKQIDSSIYTVISHDFLNRPNNPPLPIFIFKAI